MHSLLVDDYGRRMRKLRVSIIDACNFRCTYCMPANATFAKVHDLLPPDEIALIVSNLVQMGIEEVRLTGGEPTLRNELLEITERLSALPLRSIGLTTNGLHLSRLAKDLKKAGLNGVNVSLDGMSEKRFTHIARRSGFHEVVKGIDAALDAGLKVKINTVLMKQNFDDVPDFLKFAEERSIEIRFLELMKIGVALDFFEDQFVPAKELLHHLKKTYQLEQMPTPEDSTAFKYCLNNGVVVGFIASESLPFCGSCSRLRLTPKGVLRSCLMKEDGLNLRGLSLAEYPAIIKRVLKDKPFERIEKIEQPMYQIGG